MTAHDPARPALAGLGTAELREAIRAVLREVLPEVARPVPEAEAGTATGGDVVLRTDADLDAFVRRVAALCGTPERQSALQAGRHGFRLAHPPGGADREQARAHGAAAADVLRVDRGAVTERTVKSAAARGARLVLGQRAVLTPLARDRARSLGIHVEREI